MPDRPADVVDARLRHALSDAVPASFWLDDVRAPVPLPALVGPTEADLVVVGGGYTGLWTALLAKEADPSVDVVLLEGGQVGWAASGRNGGFVSSSLTHGLLNGLARFPDELPLLLSMGQENLDGLASTLTRYGIDAEWEPSGELSVATQTWQLDGLTGHARQAERFGLKPRLLDREEVRAELDSPTFLGGLLDERGAALVNPARLAWGLKSACEGLGVRIFEHTNATSLSDERGRIRVRTADGEVRAPRVALATNAFPALLRRSRNYVVPVWDYVLVTEPLSPAQLESIGWGRRRGVSDAGNQFHYFRLTADNRILWGGYDAIYYYGSDVSETRAQRPETLARLAQQFFDTFPQLEDVRFTHNWGGAIDTCTRFCQFWGTARGGRVAYVLGYTGLGVGASRFGAQVMLDLLAGARNPRTKLDMVRRKPVPFPPEPLRFAAIQLTRHSIARADRHGGRRDLWLRTLDRLGLGFDS